MTQDKPKVSSEWTHMFDADDIHDDVVSITISPDEETRTRLAKRLNIVSLDDLKANITLENEQGGSVVHVTGKIRADVTQNCVVSMEPIKNHVEDEFEAWFAAGGNAVSLAKARQKKMIEKGNREMPMIEEREDPEEMIDGEIDLGELVTQHLSLAIDPYPHAEGVEYEIGDDKANAASAVSFKNPFAALKDWKAKTPKKD